MYSNQIGEHNFVPIHPKSQYMYLFLRIEKLEFQGRVMHY